MKCASSSDAVVRWSHCLRRQQKKALFRQQPARVCGLCMSWR